MTRAERLRVWLGGGAATLAAGGVAIFASVTTHQHMNMAVNTSLVPLIGWAFAATGLIAWTRRPENGTGRLLVFVSLAWLVGGWQPAHDATIYTIGQLLSALVLAAFAHLLLAYPSGRLQSLVERRVVIGGYSLAIAANVLTLFVDPHPSCEGTCPTNLIYSHHSATFAHVTNVVTDGLATALIAAILVFLIRHWRAASPAARRGLRFILPVGVLSLVLISVGFAVDPWSNSISNALATIGLLVFATVPFLVLADQLRTRLARGGIAELLFAVSEATSVGDAETALRRALGDPLLQLAVWWESRRSYIDCEERPFTVPADGSTRVATMIESEQGGRLAVIVHDVSLFDQPELLSGVVAATQLALDRDRLQFELRANLAELERERDFIREVVNASPAFFSVLEPDGKIVRFNEAVIRATGIVDDERVRGRPLEDVLIAERDRAAVAKVIAAAHPGPHEHRWLGRDGAELVVEWSLTPIADAQGEPRLLLTGLDISERAHHEEELRGSRLRLVEAADAERRRLERNLHDGAQQRLVALSLALRLAQSKLATDPARADAILSDAAGELALALQELRELARGIHPAMLTDRGLRAALESLAERSPVPVELDVDPGGRFAAPVEAASFYVVSEALANVAKYAHASRVGIRVERGEDNVSITIADDGVGGASPAAGSGLRGLVDRVEALGGRLDVTSPQGQGTIVRAELPLAAREPVGVEPVARS